MQYLRCYQFPFDHPNWLKNVGFLILCVLAGQFLPILPQIVLYGYMFEVIEYLHKHGDRGYPDFDINKLVPYLSRGLWPFLVVFVCTLPIGIAYFVLYVISMVAFAATESPELFLVMLSLTILIVLAAAILINLAIYPLMLYSGLTQGFAFAPAMAFTKDFLGRMWKEIMLAVLFLVVTLTPLVFAGMLVFCVGHIAVMGAFHLVWAFMMYQLYELYLQRGGTPVPFKSEKPKDDEDDYERRPLDRPAEERISEVPPPPRDERISDSPDA